MDRRSAANRKSWTAIFERSFSGTNRASILFNNLSLSSYDLFYFQTDTTAPNIKLIRPLPVKTDQPTWEFTWTSDEIANFTCAVDSLSTKEDCGFGLNGRYPTKPLSDAVHTFYLFGEDELGNAARVIIHRWRVSKYNLHYVAGVGSG